MGKVEAGRGGSSGVVAAESHPPPTPTRPPQTQAALNAEREVAGHLPLELLAPMITHLTQLWADIVSVLSSSFLSVVLTDLTRCLAPPGRAAAPPPLAVRALASLLGAVRFPAERGGSAGVLGLSEEEVRGARAPEAPRSSFPRCRRPVSLPRAPAAFSSQLTATRSMVDQLSHVLRATSDPATLAFAAGAASRLCSQVGWSAGC